MIGRLVLVVSILALFALVFDFWSSEPGEVANGNGERAPLSYYLRDALVTDFAEDGSVRLEVSAVSATEDPASLGILLEGVNLDYLALPDQRWRLTAERGRVAQGQDSLELEGNVVMTGRRAGEDHPAVVRTSRLELDTRGERASTDAEVTLDFGQHAITARGLQADLKAETLRLESSVNGRFVP